MVLDFEQSRIDWPFRLIADRDLFFSNYGNGPVFHGSAEAESNARGRVLIPLWNVSSYKVITIIT